MCLKLKFKFHFNINKIDFILSVNSTLNNSNKYNINNSVTLDKSAISKEIKLHLKTYKSSYSIDCDNYSKYKDKNTDKCNTSCINYIKFKCSRRVRSPGACNGCSKYTHCRYDKFKYIASDAQHEDEEELRNSRIGINATRNEIRELGLFIKPLIDKGQSIYSILNNHNEINTQLVSLL